jgi:predicted HAD superfamily Cof-like phosphohydrolase
MSLAKFVDPRSWGDFVVEVGPSYAVIFALLAILGFLAFKGVPALINLTQAIQANTDQNVATEKATHEVLAQNAQNSTAIISNQQQIIAQHDQMIKVLNLVSASMVSPSTAYDADDRAALWKQHKRDLERIDELNHKVEKLGHQ